MSSAPAFFSFPLLIVAQEETQDRKQNLNGIVSALA